MTVTAHARRILRNKLDWIADALEPGCDHDIVSGLNEEEREAFEEVYKMGVPKEVWIGNKQADEGGGAVIGPMVRMIDPQYYEDYWKKSGYLGTEKNSLAVRDRICFTTKIKTVYIPQVSGQAEEQNDKAVDGRNSVDTAWQKMIMSSGNTKPYIELENLPEHPFDYLFGLKVQILSGKVKVQELSIYAVKDGKLVIEKAFGEGSLEECLAQIDPEMRYVLTIRIISQYRPIIGTRFRKRNIRHGISSEIRMEHRNTRSEKICSVMDLLIRGQARSSPEIFREK